MPIYRTRRLRQGAPVSGRLRPITRLARIGCLSAITALGACSPTPEVTFHATADYPERLSAWGVIQQRGGRLVLGRDVLAYDVNTPLFMDYALKLRTIWMPGGVDARFHADRTYAMPTGTILSKTFFYPLRDGMALAAPGWDGDIGGLDLKQTRAIETRLLVRQASGWEAVPYVWRGNDALLTITGEVQAFDLLHNGGTTPLNYIVPTRNDCATCHATGNDAELLPIGITTRQLNRGYHGASGNQLEQWQLLGLLAGVPPRSGWARNADWRDPHEPLPHRARSYLDANCGHCHNPHSATDTSGLWLDYREHPPRRMGLCKPPIAAGRGTGGRLWSIVPGRPDASILTFRMATTDPGMRMPELGRTLADQEAVATVSAWVESLQGACG